MFPADLPRPRQRSPYHVIERGVKRAERKTLSPGPEPATRPASSPSGLNPADARTPCDAAVYGPRLPLWVISPWAKEFLWITHGDRPEFHHPLRRRSLARRAVYRKRFFRYEVQPSSAGWLFIPGSEYRRESVSLRSEAVSFSNKRRACGTIACPFSWCELGSKPSEAA